MSKVIRSIYAQHPTYVLAYSVGIFFVELQNGVHEDLYQAVMQFLFTQMSSLKCTVGMPIVHMDNLPWQPTWTKSIFHLIMFHPKFLINARPNPDVSSILQFCKRYQVYPHHSRSL